MLSSSKGSPNFFLLMESQSSLSVSFVFSHFVSTNSQFRYCLYNIGAVTVRPFDPAIFIKGPNTIFLVIESPSSLCVSFFFLFVVSINPKSSLTNREVEESGRHFSFLKPKEKTLEIQF